MTRRSPWQAAAPWLLDSLRRRLAYAGSEAGTFQLDTVRLRLTIGGRARELPGASACTWPAATRVSREGEPGRLTGRLMNNPGWFGQASGHQQKRNP